MRKITLLWLVLAAFCATALFHTSQKVHDEHVKLAALDESIGKEQESLRLLNAEWSYLNQPARLEKLAKAYLGPMAPLKGSQFVKVEDIPLRGAVVAETTKVASAPVVKINETQSSHPRSAHRDQWSRSKSASARHVNSHDGQTILWNSAQARGGGSASTKSATNSHSFTDLMKNLRSGVE